MKTIVIIIGVLIGAIIGWNWKRINYKGKCTSFAVNKDGTVDITYRFRKRFGNLNDKKIEGLVKLLKQQFKGFKEITTFSDDSGKLEYIITMERLEDLPFIFDIDIQEELLTNYFRYD